MTTLLLNVLRVLIVLFVVRLVYRFVAGLYANPRAPSRAVPERRGGTLVRDPQCGTYVPESRALKSGPYHFCSPACRDAWRDAHEAGAARHTEATRV